MGELSETIHQKPKGIQNLNLDIFPINFSGPSPFLCYFPAWFPQHTLCPYFFPSFLSPHQFSLLGSLIYRFNCPGSLQVLKPKALTDYPFLQILLHLNSSLTLLCHLSVSVLVSPISGPGSTSPFLAQVPLLQIQ